MGYFSVRCGLLEDLFMMMYEISCQKIEICFLINYDVGINEIYRVSIDKGINNYGKYLINLCKIIDL